MGETEVTEGNTLHLLCDGSNSDPQPTLQWISPDGKMVSESGELDIVTTTRNMTGIYTCVATFPHSTATMNTTVDITIVSSKVAESVVPFSFAHAVECPTLKSTDAIIVYMSSTAVGSTATYQCRDGPTDVYTTQCTSTGVWDPHPLSTLDCTQSNGPGTHLFTPVAFCKTNVTVSLKLSLTNIHIMCSHRRNYSPTKPSWGNNSSSHCLGSNWSTIVGALVKIVYTSYKER